jgi:hypothetical protein
MLIKTLSPDEIISSLTSKRFIKIARIYSLRTQEKWAQGTIGFLSDLLKIMAS